MSGERRAAMQLFLAPRRFSLGTASILAAIRGPIIPQEHAEMPHSIRNLSRSRAFTSAVAPLRRVAAVAVLALCGLAGGAKAEIKQAPGSRVAMDVPANFTPSGRFSGFVDETNGSSFLVVEMPGVAYDQLKTIGDQKDALAQKGLDDAKVAQLPGRTGEYVYIVASQKTPAGTYAKHILVAREGDVTAMITANIPEKALAEKTVTAEQVERALVSVSVKSEVAESRELFSLGYLGPFKPSLSMFGSSKAYSLTGKVPEHGSQGADEPILVVAPSIDKTPIADVNQAARHFFDNFAGITGQVIKAEKEVAIAGLKGRQIVGEGSNPKAERTGIFVLLLAGEKGGYYMIAGSARSADMGAYLPEFEKIAASFQPKAAE